MINDQVLIKSLYHFLPVQEKKTINPIPNGKKFRYKRK